jgi:pyruvate kinase
MASSAKMSLALTPVTDLGRYCGLRRQQWRSQSFVAQASSRHGGNSSASVAVVRATGLRPRRLPEQEAVIVPVSPDDDRLDLAPGATKLESTLSVEQLLAIHKGRTGMWVKPSFQRKTKIVCTIGPTSNTREMIWKLADAGMNVARLNMSHGDHASHKKVIDLVREFNAQAAANVIAIMLDTKV